MKKFKLLILLLVFTLLPINVFASTDTQDRNTLPNLGVNKKWEITSENRSNVLNSYKVDASEKIYDFADILSDEDEEWLYSTIHDFIRKYNMDLVVLTDKFSYSSDKQNEDFAVDFYDYNDFGLDFDKYNGIIIFINMNPADRYFNFYMFGDSQLYFDNSRKQEPINKAMSYMKMGKYYSGVKSMISCFKKYIDDGIPSDLKNYYVDEKGFLQKVSESSDGKQDRSKLPNLGVNKKITITKENKYNILNTYKVDASKKIYDFSEIFSEEEENKLLEKINQFSKKHNVDLAVLTDTFSYSSDKQNDDFAVDFYDYNDFGIEYEKYDGFLIFINMNPTNRFYNFYLTGNTQLYFDQTRKDEPINSTMQYMKNGEYYDAIIKMIDLFDEYLDKGIPSELDGYYLDEKGFLQKPFRAPWAGIIGADVVITLITLIILIKKNKMVKKKLATTDYVNKEGANYRVKTDQFIRSYVTSHTVSSSSGGHGGGGGGHSSFGGSSGIGHSSGSGGHF